MVSNRPCILIADDHTPHVGTVQEDVGSNPRKSSLQGNALRSEYATYTAYESADH
jgi:hypothetical protein